MINNMSKETHKNFTFYLSIKAVGKLKKRAKKVKRSTNQTLQILIEGLK